MRRSILQLSRLARIQTAQPIPPVFWTATRTCPLRVPIASTSVATCSPVRMASSTNQPSTIRFSEGEDTEQVVRGLNSLRQRGWQLDQDGMGVTKTFYFKAYFKAVVCSPFSLLPFFFFFRPEADRRLEFCQCNCG